MKYILTLITISLTLTATSQKNIYSPLLPLSVQYINKTGVDSNFNFFLSQSYLDSLRFTYDSMKNHRTAINILNGQIATTNSNLTTTNNSLGATQQTVSNQGLQLQSHTGQLSGLQTQVATDGVNIAQLQSQVGTKPIPRTITASVYQIISTDNGQVLLFPNKCIISISSSIQMPFNCDIIQQGATNTGQVQISSTSNTNSISGWKRIKSQYGKVSITEVANGIFNLNGDLKL